MADNHGVTFLYPTGNHTFYYLDTVNVSYISPFATPLMYTFCDKGGRQIRVQPAGPLNGSTLVLLNFTSTTPCYFDLRPSTEGGHGANSDSFNLEVNVQSQATMGLSQSDPAQPATLSSSGTSTSASATTTSESSSATSTSTSTTSSTTTSTASSTPAASAGLSTGAAAGIGVGVGLAVILLLVGIIALFLRRRRRNRQTDANSNAPPPAYPDQQHYVGTALYPGPAGDNSPNGEKPRFEAPGAIPAVEADAGRDGTPHANARSEQKDYYGQKEDGSALSSPEPKAAFLPGSRGSEFARSPPPQELPGSDWTQYNGHGAVSN